MAKVGIIMGSKSDYPVMMEAENILKEFNIDYEIEIVSAHRTPEKMMDYSKNAHKRGINVIIAGAGGAAARCPPHLHRKRLNERLCGCVDLPQRYGAAAVGTCATERRRAWCCGVAAASH